MENNKTLLISLFIISSLLLGTLIGFVISPNAVEIEVPVITEKIVMPNCSAMPDFVLSESEFELTFEEAKAEELFLISIESRDFKKSVFGALLIYGESIDSYKDITNIKYEYNVNGNEIEVENVKVYYFIDSDEDETEKALLEDFLVEIDNLDFDDLDESEVNENYLDNLLVNKVY